MRTAIDARMSFAIKLKAARESAGFSQEQLAEAIGSTQAFISRIERGIDNPRLATMAELCAVLDRKLLVDIA